MKVNTSPSKAVAFHDKEFALPEDAKKAAVAKSNIAEKFLQSVQSKKSGKQDTANIITMEKSKSVQSSSKEQKPEEKQQPSNIPIVSSVIEENPKVTSQIIEPLTKESSDPQNTRLETKHEPIGQESKLENSNISNISSEGKAKEPIINPDELNFNEEVEFGNPYYVPLEFIK